MGHSEMGRFRTNGEALLTLGLPTLKSLALGCAKSPVTSGMGAGVGTPTSHKYIEGIQVFLKYFP